VKTRTSFRWACLLIVLAALSLAACGGQGSSAPDQETGRQVEAAPQQSEGADGVLADASQEDTITDEGFAELDLLTELFESESIPFEAEVTGSDFILGGSPDSASAAAIVLGLEEAGFDLSDIDVSVLPISGMDASLLVLEVTDDVEALISEDEEGAALARALLASPEIEDASITEIVSMYRGTDELGSFVMTFTISITALREAQATGADVGDELLVQIERGP
jgi:predicted small lipoprotein YifL